MDGGYNGEIIIQEEEIIVENNNNKKKGMLKTCQKFVNYLSIEIVKNYKLYQMNKSSQYNQQQTEPKQYKFEVEELRSIHQNLKTGHCNILN